MSKAFAEMNVTTGPPTICRVGTSSLMLLTALTLTVALAALNYLVPKVSEFPGTSMRLGWYVRSGQWHADVRTMAAAFQYLMTPDQNISSGTNSPTNQLAIAVSEAGWSPTRINKTAARTEWRALPMLLST